MTDTLVRLCWALPLVLGVGLCVVLLMKNAASGARLPVRRLLLVESLRLSDETSVHLIEVDRRPLLVTDSLRRVTTQDAGPPHVAQAARPGSWLQMMLRRSHAEVRQ